MRANTVLVNIMILLTLLLVFGCSQKEDNMGMVAGSSINGVVEGTLPESIKLNFEFIEKSDYNINALKALNNTPKDGVFLFMDIVNSQADLEYYAREGEFKYPEEVNFESNIVLIAYGREIAVLERARDKLLKSYALSVTFVEEYSGATVFFYYISRDDGISFVHPRMHGVHCYVKHGEERIYVGSDMAGINGTISGEGGSEGHPPGHRANIGY